MLKVEFPFCTACRTHAWWSCAKGSPTADVLGKLSIMAGLALGALLGIVLTNAVGLGKGPAGQPASAAAIPIVIVLAIAGMFLPWYAAKLGDLVFGRRRAGCTKGACVTHYRAGEFGGGGTGLCFRLGNAEFDRAFREANTPLIEIRIPDLRLRL